MPDQRRAAYDRRYQERHADEIRERRRRRYLAAHPESANRRPAGPRQRGNRKDEAFAAFLRRRYGLTVVEFEAMLAAQGGACALCGQPNPIGKRLSVDHDHGLSGEVRGLLCVRCNTQVGRAEAVIADPLPIALYLGRTPFKHEIGCRLGPPTRL